MPASKQTGGTEDEEAPSAFRFKKRLWVPGELMTASFTCFGDLVHSLAPAACCQGCGNGDYRLRLRSKTMEVDLTVNAITHLTATRHWGMWKWGKCLSKVHVHMHVSPTVTQCNYIKGPLMQN